MCAKTLPRINYRKPPRNLCTRTTIQNIVQYSSLETNQSQLQHSHEHEAKLLLSKSGT